MYILLMEKAMAPHSSTLAWKLHFPGGSDTKQSACNAGDLYSIPESG